MHRSRTGSSSDEMVRSRRLVKATELVGLPVVTLGGDDIAEVKDVVYEPTGRLVGFTLNKRGFLSGRLKQILAVDEVASIGRDTVMTDTEEALTDKSDAPESVEAAADRNVIGASVVTNAGTKFGEVVDLVVSVGGKTEAVGYELASTGDDARHVFLPLPEQLSVSGEAVIVPSGLDDFVRDDLTGFGSAVERYREDHGFHHASGGASTTRSGATAPSVDEHSTEVELYERARELDVPGRSSMTKAELSSALEEAGGHA